MESLIKLVALVARGSRFGIELLLILLIVFVVIVSTRRIVVDRKNQYYSYNDKREKVKELEEDIKKDPE